MNGRRPSAASLAAPAALLGDIRALIEAARREADVVVSAIVGVAGLAPTVAAFAPGRRVALANKMARIVWALMAKGGVYQSPVAAA